MANICLYKILVKGRKKACYKLIDMMPLYSYDKIILREEGTDDDFELVFSGDCKWSVDSYTNDNLKLQPYTDKEIDEIQDGDGWNIPLKGKSIVLDCEIFCNSKDIDDSCWANYVHYNRGVKISDECPKILHIKRGRDYDCYEDLIETEYGAMTIDDYNGMLRKKGIVTARVKFEIGCYWYLNPENFVVGDLVYVKGPAKEGCLGKIISVSNQWDNWAGVDIDRKVGHVNFFKTEEIESIWKSYKPKDRKLYLIRIGLEESLTKQKFLNIIEHRWNEYCLNKKEENWDDFLNTIR